MFTRSSIFIILVLIITIIATSDCGQPSYQVSIFVSLHPRAAPFHMCNGVILQSRVILTAASCTYYQFRAQDPPISIDASRISILAGSTNKNDVSSLAIPVKEVHIADNFQLATKENDVAMLLLDSSLPLALREDMKWIVLDDNEHENNTCYGNFYARNSLDSVPDNEQTEELPIHNKTTCNQTDTLRSRDLCSNYYLPLDFDCKEYNEFMHMNGDRGAGLVCNSRLVAILSTILPLSSANLTTIINENTAENCSDLAVSAIYTALGPHLDWIYSVVAYEEYLDLSENNYISAAPYQQNSTIPDQTGSESISSTDSDGTLITPTPTPTATTAATAATRTTTPPTETISTSTYKPFIIWKPHWCGSAGSSLFSRTTTTRSQLIATFIGVAGMLVGKQLHV